MDLGFADWLAGRHERGDQASMITVRLHGQFRDLVGADIVELEESNIRARQKSQDGSVQHECDGSTQSCNAGLKLQEVLSALVARQPALRRYVLLDDDNVFRSNALVVSRSGALVLLGDVVPDGSLIELMPAPIGG